MVDALGELTDETRLRVLSSTKSTEMRAVESTPVVSAPCRAT